MSVALAMREQSAGENDLLERLAADSRLQLSLDELHALIAEPLSFTGAAAAQVQSIVGRVAAITAEHPVAAGYSPGDIL